MKIIILKFIAICALSLTLGSGGGFWLSLISFIDIPFPDRFWFILSSSVMGGLFGVLLFPWFFYKRCGGYIDDLAAAYCLAPLLISAVIGWLLSSAHMGWIGLISYPLLFICFALLPRAAKKTDLPR